MTGRKAHDPAWVNQDAYLVLPLGPSKVIVAVFDGHGAYGHLVAAKAREFFEQRGPGLMQMGDDHGAGHIPDLLHRLFGLAHEAVDRTGLAEWSGTTAVVALIDVAAQVFTTAHVGDSRLVLGCGSEVHFETADHVVDEAAERRVVAAGGDVRALTVSGVAARRVFLRGLEYPGLGMSRALGDTQAHAVGVLSEPTVTNVRLAPGSAIILASDGVWEKVAPRTAANIVARRGGDASAAAQALVTEARSRWLEDGGDIDDISAVVVQIPAFPAPAG